MDKLYPGLRSEGNNGPPRQRRQFVLPLQKQQKQQQQQQQKSTGREIKQLTDDELRLADELTSGGNPLVLAEKIRREELKRLPTHEPFPFVPEFNRFYFSNEYWRRRLQAMTYADIELELNQNITFFCYLKCADATFSGINSRDENNCYASCFDMYYYGRILILTALDRYRYVDFSPMLPEVRPVSDALNHSRVLVATEEINYHVGPWNTKEESKEEYDQ